jgi:hypothetical protein
LQIGRMPDIDLISEPPTSPPHRCMYPKCGNLCGQRVRKRFIIAGVSGCHIFVPAPHAPPPKGKGQRSKVVILPTTAPTSQVATLLNSFPPSLPVVADMQLAAGISFSRLAANQTSCPSTLQATKSSLAVRAVQVEGASLLCDVARGITRPLVPLADRAAVFHAIHTMAHPGICATKHMVTARFVWKGVGKDMAAMCRDCQQYQRGKVHKQPTAPLQSRHACSPMYTWTWWIIFQPLQMVTCNC